MNPQSLRLMSASLLAAITLDVAPALAQNSTPNVVFILADNVGYGDLGPYGGGELRGAPTPRIDELAREGLRLTQYLVEPGCTISRYYIPFIATPHIGVGIAAHPAFPDTALARH